jgi:hypothetical protein
LTPRIVLTDQAAMLAIRPKAEAPMAQLLPRNDEPGLTTIECDAGNGAALASVGGTVAEWSASCGVRFSVGAYQLQLAPGFDSDRDAVIEAIGLMVQHVELGEPFGRIHEAICEAQRIGGRTVAGHDQAA